MTSLQEVLRSRATQKLYSDNPNLFWAVAKVLEIRAEGIRLDRTVAYPESGGQEGDRGFLETPTRLRLPFQDTQRGPGRVLFLEGFCGVHVDVPIYHVLTPEDACRLTVGDEVIVSIDIERRQRLSLSHTGSHLLYLAVKRLRPKAVDHVIGCHIQEDQARFDFRVEERFSSAELADIQCVANEYVLRDYPIQIHTHPDEPEARYWVCNGETIPCGGTHISSTALVGSITVQRKNIGKCKDRLVAKFMQSREVGP